MADVTQPPAEDDATRSRRWGAWAGSERTGHVLNFWGLILGPILGALVAWGIVALTTGANASEDSLPMIRVDGHQWVNNTPEIIVTGHATGLRVGERVWLFTSRADDYGGAYPAGDQCAVSEDGAFSCRSYAGGGPEEDGLLFDLTVAVVSADQADDVQERVDDMDPYSSRHAIPHVTGVWTTHTVSDERPPSP